MSRRKGTFADALDIFGETGSEQEVRDAANQLGVWARVRKLGFKVKVEDAKQTVAKPAQLDLTEPKA